MKRTPPQLRPVGHFNDPAKVHNRDSMCDVTKHGEIVGNENV
tara:strand:+ start:269 stop:394 length:126 start_codon:yes stop_codon:yes gene_type:complete